MRCDRTLPQLEAYVDGELRGWRKLAVRRHVNSCPSCAFRHSELLELRARVRAEAPRYAAPAKLRTRVLRLLESSSAATPRPMPERHWRWAGAGALAGCAFSVFAWLAGSALLSQRADHDLALAAVDAHVRATLGNQLMQIASSDQHTVKPWLSARLDYSPPVRDLEGEGFPLRGARIEIIDGSPVATLVYRYRQHNVDVFVRPNGVRSPTAARRSIRGFNVIQLSSDGMQWLAVSDASAETLSSFLGRLAESGIPK